MQKQTQRKRLLKLLSSNLNRQVALPKILKLGIAQYNTRIHEIRKDGYIIENILKIDNGIKKSWYVYKGKRRN